jgi:flavorubredoxin
VLEGYSAALLRPAVTFRSACVNAPEAIGDSGANWSVGERSVLAPIGTHRLIARFIVARVDHLTGGIYRISTYAPEKRISFNQFLIDDDEPALIHTGTFPMYADVRLAIAQVLDPSRLRHVIVPHFEADECGGMGRFVAEAANAALACSAVGARINLLQWDYAGPVKGMQDGDVLDLGRHRLRFWETPHVHHWDSLMVLEETTASLFPSDLFIQPNDQPAIVRENLGADMCGWYRAAGLFWGC